MRKGNCLVFAVCGRIRAGKADFEAGCGFLRQRDGAVMRYQFIAQVRKTYPVRLCCRVLGVSKSDFYQWVRCVKPTDRRVADQHMMARIGRAHQPPETDNSTPPFTASRSPRPAATHQPGNCSTGANPAVTAAWKHYASSNDDYPMSPTKPCSPTTTPDT
jgi:hypothetical protein